MGRTSSKRDEILHFLTKFTAENGYAPSVREICAAVGLQSTATVHYHLNALRQDGLIEMDGMEKRTITLADSTGPTASPSSAWSRQACPFWRLKILKAICRGTEKRAALRCVSGVIP